MAAVRRRRRRPPRSAGGVRRSRCRDVPRPVGRPHRRRTAIAVRTNGTCARTRGPRGPRCRSACSSGCVIRTTASRRRGAARAASPTRERLTTELLAIVEGDPEAHGGLQAGIASAALFYEHARDGQELMHPADPRGEARADGSRPPDGRRRGDSTIRSRSSCCSTTRSTGSSPIPASMSDDHARARRDLRHARRRSSRRTSSSSRRACRRSRRGRRGRRRRRRLGRASATCCRGRWARPASSPASPASCSIRPIPARSARATS